MSRHDNNTIIEIVHSLLVSDAKTRDDDMYLYSRVLSKVSPTTLVLPLVTFLSGKFNQDIPSIECVGRARRKCQELYPELAPSEKCKRRKTKLQKEYHDFYGEK